MKDISCHILDIAQNSISAGADEIRVFISENTKTSEFILIISDNGCGISDEIKEQILDPFYTTSVTKKVGLGLPLLKQNAELTGGKLNISSVIGKGTEVIAIFNASHIDMIPVGDLVLTFKTLIAGNPEKNFIYRHQIDHREFIFETSSIRRELEDIKINSFEVLEYINDLIKYNLEALTIE